MRLIPCAVVVLAGGLFVQAGVRGASIGVQLYGAGTALPGSEAAGVVPQTSWTTLEAGATSTNLADSNGIATTASIITAGTQGNGTNSLAISGSEPTKGTDELFSGFESNGGASPQYAITNIPYPTYNAYVYVLRTNSGNETIAASITGFSSPVQSQLLVNETPGSFTGAYDNAATGAGNIGDYVLFTNLTSPSLYLYTPSFTIANPAFSAIEIVATPEPASLAFMSVGILGLLARRRRSSTI